MLKCSACAKFMGRGDGIACPKCSLSYHRACVGVPAATAAPRDWSCPACKRYLPTDNRSNTPVRGAVAAVAPPAAAAAANDEPPAPHKLTEGAAVAGSGGEEVQSVLSCEIRLFREELQTVRQEIREFRQEFFDIRTCLTDFGKKVDNLDGRVDAIEKKLADSTIAAGTKVLEEAILTLQMELSDRDQELLRNDLQISNVPEEPGENTAHLVTLVAAKLDVQLDVRDVVSVYRAGRAREAGAGRPRPIVLRLARRAIRDEVLRGARVRRAVTTAELGLSTAPVRFYVNERLTATNRQLFRQARERARSAGWRYVWTRDGQVLARRADGLPSHRLRRMVDLNIF